MGVHFRPGGVSLPPAVAPGGVHSEQAPENFAQVRYHSIDLGAMPEPAALPLLLKALGERRSANLESLRIAAPQVGARCRRWRIQSCGTEYTSTIP